jgi:hypothetical protein
MALSRSTFCSNRKLRLTGSSREAPHPFHRFWLSSCLDDLYGNLVAEWTVI